MIKNGIVGEVADQITKWIEDQVLGAGARTAVVGLSGGADSALVAILCKRSPKIDTVVVRMPCQARASSLTRAQELINAFGLTALTVDLDGAYRSIGNQVAAQNPSYKGLEIDDLPESASGALKSCLRAPTLDLVAKITNGIIVGTGNRDEDEVTRYFQKRGDGSVDISPIAKLHKSEVYQLLTYLGCPQSIIDAVPSADLFEGQTDEAQLGITYPEIEWAIQENDATYGGLFNDNGYGLSLERYLSYTPRQLEVLKVLTKMEKASRHKAALPPVFDPRTPDLFE